MAIQPIAETVSYIAASLLLLIRVLTLYHKNRLLAWVMYGIFILTHGIGVAIMARTLVVLLRKLSIIWMLPKSNEIYSCSSILSQIQCLH
jgi:hypothetical protein